MGNRLVITSMESNLKSIFQTKQNLIDDNTGGNEHTLMHVFCRCCCSCFLCDFYHIWGLKCFVMLCIRCFVFVSVWILLHINHCRLFNDKSIFIQINSSISNNSV